MAEEYKGDISISFETRARIMISDARAFRQYPLCSFVFLSLPVERALVVLCTRNLSQVQVYTVPLSVATDIARHHGPEQELSILLVPRTLSQNHSWSRCRISFPKISLAGNLSASETIHS